MSVALSRFLVRSRYVFAHIRAQDVTWARAVGLVSPEIDTSGCTDESADRWGLISNLAAAYRNEAIPAGPFDLMGLILRFFSSPSAANRGTPGGKTSLPERFNKSREGVTWDG